MSRNWELVAATKSLQDLGGVLEGGGVVLPSQNELPPDLQKTVIIEGDLERARHEARRAEAAAARAMEWLKRNRTEVVKNARKMGEWLTEEAKTPDKALAAYLL